MLAVGALAGLALILAIVGCALADWSSSFSSYKHRVEKATNDKYLACDLVTKYGLWCYYWTVSGDCDLTNPIHKLKIISKLPTVTTPLIKNEKLGAKGVFTAENIASGTPCIDPAADKTYETDKNKYNRLDPFGQYSVKYYPKFNV